MTKNQYYVYSNLHHDGRAYRPGDLVSLSEKAAEQLIASGVVGTEKPAGPAPAPENARIQTPEQKAELREAKVGGEQPKTGEPSIDGRDGNAPRTEATDVTPPVDNGEQPKTGEPASKALEDMNREELRLIATSEGIPAEEVSGTFTSKAAIIDLITKKRAQPQQPEQTQPQAQTPENDPSANL